MYKNKKNQPYSNDYFFFFIIEIFSLISPSHSINLLEKNCVNGSNPALDMKIKKLKITEDKNKNQILSLNIEITNKIKYSHLNIYNPAKHFFLIIDDSFKILCQKKKDHVLVDKKKKTIISFEYLIPAHFLKIDLFYYCPDYGNIKINLVEIGNSTPKTNYEFTKFSFSGITVGIVKVFNINSSSRSGLIGLFEFVNKNSSERKLSTNTLFRFVDNNADTYSGKLLNYKKESTPQETIELIPGLKEKNFFFFPGLKSENINHLLLKSKLGNKTVYLERF